MSQPSDRGANVLLPGKLDTDLGEWWVKNPWDIVKNGKNLSAYERKRVFLNVAGPDGGRDFLDISYLTGADGDGDGRCVVAGDFRNNGQQDLVVRQSGGGPVLLYENHFPVRHALEVSLRGHPDKKLGRGEFRSNTLGIGARLTAWVNGQKLVRELYPLNSYRSQMPAVVHFGLGQATKVDRLKIQWPSGKVQVLTDLAGDRHIRVDEEKDGPAAVEVVRSWAK